MSFYFLQTAKEYYAPAASDGAMSIIHGGAPSVALLPGSHQQRHHTSDAFLMLFMTFGDSDVSLRPEDLGGPPASTENHSHFLNFRCFYFPFPSFQKHITVFGALPYSSGDCVHSSSKYVPTTFLQLLFCC